MTKDELLQDVANENYKNVQAHIRNVMEDGGDSIDFYMEGYVDYDDEWLCRDRVINMLKNDGFTINIDKTEHIVTVSWEDDNEQSFSNTKYIW